MIQLGRKPFNLSLEELWPSHVTSAPRPGLCYENSFSRPHLVDINSPAVERIGKRGKKSQPITGAKKALKALCTTSVVTTNAYTGKKVVIPGLKRSALAEQQVAPGRMQPSTLAMVSNSAFLCTSDGCAASACYGYEQMNGQPDKCSAHRLEEMVPMV